MHTVWRSRLLTCVELLWVQRMYAIYVAILFSVYLARRLLGAAWLEEAELWLAGLWFVPALAAVAVGRLRTSDIRDEREAALALMEFVHRLGGFCTAASLTVKAVVLLGVLSFAVLMLTPLLPEFYMRLALLLILFAPLYSWIVNRELDQLRRELELLEELKKSYEKISR